MRLSTWIPSFAKAAAELAWFTQVHLSRETARRVTEAAGAVAVALETAEAARILHEHPTPPAGPDHLVLSVDGAMIPLVHGQWTEVRTLAVGEVRSDQGGDILSRVTNLSYFSRRTDSTTFAELALVELHRRGIETAKRVGAVVDGAEWCQQFIDLHRPDAVRILDFAHAAEYVAAIAQSCGAEGSLLPPSDLRHLLHTLKHDGPELVLAELRTRIAAHPTLLDLPKHLAYLEKRIAQLAYPQFQADGWPIGSGMVESANKLVVEDRLKGAGMHWADHNVNPLLALRNAVCNDRWEEVWTQIEVAQRQQRAARRRAPQRSPRSQTTSLSRGGAEPAAVAAPPPPEAPHRQVQPAATTHPWRRAWSLRRQRELASTI